MANLATPLNQTPNIFKWYMACLIMIDHPHDTCFDEIEEHAQNIEAILGSIVNISGRTRERERVRTFTLTSCNFCIMKLGMPI